MRLLKYIMLLLMAGPLMGQDSHPSVIVLDIRPGGIGYEWPSTYMAREPTEVWARTDDLNVNAYNLDQKIVVDSVYFPLDSLANLNGETVYSVTIDSLTGRKGSSDYSGIDTLVQITVRK